MEKIRKAAMFSVGRAVFFGGFAISIVMLSLAFNFALALKGGAILTLIMALILLWCTLTAEHRSPKSTETWILLDDRSRPVNGHAVRAFRLVMKEVYGFYAYYSTIIALGMFGGSVTLQLLGISGGLG